MRWMFTMAMTPILVLATLARPWVGVVTLVLVYYIRPGIWDAPAWFQLVEIMTWTTMVGLILHRIRGRCELRLPAAGILMALLVASAYLSASAAQVSEEAAFARAEVYLKCAVVGFLVLTLLDDVSKLNGFLWAVVGGTFWLVKSAIVLLATSNPDRVNSIGGQGGGANYLALMIVVSLPILLYKVQGGRGKERLIAAVAIPFWILALILSGSRGGFLAVGLEVVLFIWFNRRRGLALVLASLCVIGVAVYAPTRFTERMETIETYEQDQSAMSRIALWKGAIRLGNRHPLLGVGPENFRLLSEDFTEERNVLGNGGLVAHNTYVHTFAEQGYLGLVLLVAAILATLAGFRRAIRTAPETVEGEDFRVLARAMMVSFLGFCAHSVVMSNLHRDVLWWWFGLGGATGLVALRLAAAAGADGVRRLRAAPRTRPARERARGLALEGRQS